MKTPINLIHFPSLHPSRRAVLRTAGTIGLLSTIGLSSTAAASHSDYGNGNGIGAFLNDEAAFKKPPIWDSGIADMTGQSTVDVSVGTMVTVHPPDSPPVQAPFGFDPMAVKVSLDAEVVWTWVAGHHSVTSYNADAEDMFDHGQTFDSHGEPPHVFSHTFTEADIYLYFCIPHGMPFPFDFGDPIGEVENLVGMRGAVLVVDE
jgi:plastocyanin